MNRKKQYFLDFLAGSANSSPLFEPMICKSNTELLIYRRSNRLWSTPSEYINTILSLVERIDSYFAFIDMHAFEVDERESLVSAASEKKATVENIGFGFICYSQDDVDAVSDTADCVCIYGDAITSAVPVIRMDGSIEDAIARGDSGWFAENDAEYYLNKYSDKIRILGGLGVDFIEGSSPMKIRKAVEKLALKYRGKWACGSGGMIANKYYLELASMLCAYSKIG